ncbi:Imm7 family immunity protein [Kitasatospora sp. NPDC101183]|uniref:Imm7 family immunity protein n=1 Tax=Kitasatospora sp. NPDC101183 TaxID=3364100 RepID=UPI0038302335
MFEYHGWVNVIETATAEEQDPAVLHAIADGLRQRIAATGGRHLLDLRWSNGALFLHLGGLRNHPDPDVLGLFREVGERAPGSYGLLHVRDDAHLNEARVLRMVRGRVSEHREALLSPCIPLLEDEF